jgi:fibronectin type 3 domain-containing protein
MKQSKQTGVYKNMKRMITDGATFRFAATRLVLLLFPALLIGQLPLPDIPDLIRVSVDHSDNGVRIEWEASSDTAVDLYHLYRLESGSFTKIFSFSAETFEYKHMTSGLENLAYAVTAFDTLDGTSSRESVFRDNVHKAVALSLEFDPCRPANLIHWTGYEGWDGKISGYRIYGGPEGSEPELLKFVHSSTLSYIHNGVSFDTTYIYYVETVHTSGMTSLSPLDSIRTLFPSAPEILTIDHVSVIDPSLIELQFTADVSGQVNQFRVMRRSGEDAPYAVVETLAGTDQPIRTVQDRIPSINASHEYVVQALYLPMGCSEPWVVSTSNPGTNVLLEGTVEDQVARLSWTPYRTYSTGLSGYIVQRRSGAGEFIDVQSLGPETTTWAETIESVVNGYQPGEIQYKVLALGNQVEGMAQGISSSNIVGVAVETHLMVPSAFTPGSNDMNFEFKPRIDFAPREYLMIIYDRGGRELFETSDPGAGWDGTYRGGGYAMEGVYVYYIRYTDYTGLLRTLSGNVTVIYPNAL